MKKFSQINYDWYKLTSKYDINIEDINVLAVIESLSKGQYGCIANNEYFHSVLNIPYVSVNLKRLEAQGLISVSNNKVRKITINYDKLKMQ